MYKQLAVALLALTMTLAVPVTVSADGDGDCAPPAEDVLLAQDVDDRTFLVTEGGAVYEDDNGFDGLQSSAGEDDCGTPDDESDDIAWDADTQLL